MLKLREMLLEMEQDIGLDDLTASERDVLLAASDLTSAPDDIIGSGQIRDHRLVSRMAQATFQRALRRLVAHGFLERPEGFKSKKYVVCRHLMEGD